MEDDLHVLPAHLPALAEASAKRYPGTCEWLLHAEVYTCWLAEPSGFLWLHGATGCGKTVATAAVVEALLAAHVSPTDGKAPAVVAYCFLASVESIERSTSYLLHSWLSQFPAGQEVRSLPVGESISEQLALLKAYIIEASGTFLVVDAIDECVDLAELMKVFSDLQDFRTSGLYVFVSSRTCARVNRGMTRLVDKEQIAVMFTRPAVQSDIEKALSDDPLPPQLDDIRLYAHHFFQEQCVAGAWTDEEGKQLEDRLVERSGGSFSWAQKQLEVLESCKDRKEAEDAMELHPTGLDETYIKLLTSIALEDRQKVRDLLAWLIFSTRSWPPSIQVLSELLVVDTSTKAPFAEPRKRPHSPLEVFTLLGDTVTLLPQFSWTFASIIRVDMMHDALKAFLMSDRIKESTASFFAIPKGEAHAIVAAMSFAYLQQFTTKDSLSNKRSPQTMTLRYIGQVLWDHVYEATGNMFDVQALARAWFASPSFEFTNNGRTKLECMARGGLLDDLRALLEAGEDPSVAFCPAMTVGKSTGDWRAAGMLLNTGRVDLERECEDGTLAEELLDTQYLPLVKTGLQYLSDIDPSLIDYALDVKDSAIFQVVLERWRELNKFGSKLPLYVLEHAVALETTTAIGTLLDYVSIPEVRGASSDKARHLRKLLQDRGLADFAPEDPKAVAIAHAIKYGNEIDVAIAQGTAVAPDIITRAISRQSIDLIRAAAAHGVPMNQPGQPNPLSGLVWLEKDATLSLMGTLLDLGADIDAQDKHGTALRYAATKYPRAVRLLLDRGANASAQRTSWEPTQGELNADASEWTCPKNQNLKSYAVSRASTPLETAAAAGSAEIVQMLLNHGVDANEQSIGGLFDRAIQAAWAMGHDEIVEILHKSGAEMDGLEQDTRLINMRKISRSEAEAAKQRAELYKVEQAAAMDKQRVQTAEMMMNVEDEWRRGELCWVPGDLMSRMGRAGSG